MRPACPCGTCPAPDLAVLLYQMIETGTGNAAYYADILYAVTILAVTAPPGPPRSAAAFLERLDAALAPGRLGRRPPPRRGGAGPRRRPAHRRHPAPLRHPARPARPRPGRPRHPG